MCLQSSPASLTFNLQTITINPELSSIFPRAVTMTTLLPLCYWIVGNHVTFKFVSYWLSDSTLQRVEM